MVQDAKGSRINQKIIKKELGLIKYFFYQILNFFKKVKYSEGTTIYRAKRNQFELFPVYRKVVCSSNNVGPKNSDLPYFLARYFYGFGQFGAGKVMGMASYSNAKPKFLFNNLIKKNGLDIDFRKRNFFQNSEHRRALRILQCSQ